MRIALALIGAASAAALALPAQAAKDDSSCFLTSDMRNHTVGDDHTMYFDVGGRSVWRAEMSNPCFAGATSSDPIILRDQAGMGRICHKLDLDVGIRGTRCIVKNLTKLTPAEVAALPKKLRP
jgi:hypothetical protein|nr:hypothetical protein [Phenylobacterium sp.]